MVETEEKEVEKEEEEEEEEEVGGRERGGGMKEDIQTAIERPAHVALPTLLLSRERME